MLVAVVNGTHAEARGTEVCPLGVLQGLRAAGWVVPQDQQDAHELLHVLLSCIDEEVTAMAKKAQVLNCLNSIFIYFMYDPNVFTNV